MSDKNHKIQIFNGQKVRTAWNADEEKWYFSIVDVCWVLAESKDYQTARKYWNKLKQRLVAEGNETVTNCHQLKMLANDGKMRLTDVADQQQLFRIIQSIPSPKAEPFKQWMAQVASDRLDQMQDPELNFQQAFEDYRRLGYSERWVNQRLQSIKARKELTDEWERAGVKEGQQYATLTDIITKEWSGKTTHQYKQYKGLKKESLRDNMTTMELALNMLAEATTVELSKSQNPKGFRQSAKVAHEGGKIAGETRAKIESQTGRPIVSKEKASDYLPPADRKESLPEEE
ncbi:MAG: Bro-N domain-containing protein [Bacteroidales bacterium]|nr:Bro-N domain-containing protein [Bacteroidales bacterium]